MSSEYGLRHVDNERVFHMHSLTDAINAWKEQDFPEHWQVVERWKSRGWTITVDGRFGSQSERVARQFQKQVKVAQDGLVGEVTFEKSWTAPVT